MTRRHGPDRPPDMERPGQCGGTETGPQSREADNLDTDHSKVISLPRERWHVPMVLAYRIGRTPPPLKPAAARCWRVAVQAALGVVRE